jgi:hypothetical protein
MSEAFKAFSLWIVGSDSLSEDMRERARFVGRAIAGTFAGPLGFITSTTNIEWSLKVLALIAGISVSVISFVSIWRSSKSKRRIDAIEIAREERRTCEGCRLGNVPIRCPIPTADRPIDCPKKHSGNVISLGRINTDHKKR